MFSAKYLCKMLKSRIRHLNDWVRKMFFGCKFIGCPWTVASVGNGLEICMICGPFHKNSYDQLCS